jgi:Protein of unknown function (DUF1838)
MANDEQSRSRGGAAPVGTAGRSMRPAGSTITRRGVLSSSLVLGIGASGASWPGLAEARPVGPGLPGTPEEHLRDIVRMQGSLREEDVPWWFTGVIFAVTGEQQTPRPLVRFEGMEIYWFRHLPDGYLLGGNTVTFFRDFETNEYLREFRNPWTQRTDVVKPAVQGGNLGFKYSTEGIWPARLDGAAIGEPARAPLRVQWHGVGEHVWLQHQTVYPPGMPPMHGQRQTMFASRRDLANRRLARVPATFSSTVFMGWLKWMDMQDQPGHVVWHASGAKLRSIDDLPREYRERAEREYPQRLTAKPKAPG